MSARSRIIVAALMSVTASAAAAEDFVKGVYLQSEELCAQAKKETIQAVIEGGNVLLTARGIEGIEYNCEFLQVTKANRAPAWLVNAICQEPGYVFPDVLSVTQMSPTQIDVVSVVGAGDEATPSNTATYQYCEGIAAP
ncbi:hypothetical protein RHIZO_03919 [Rhizobiaceae bacterium]|nr:hypothetical protein RHIZO_03919 [Rhizobiaceae bacterium]